MQNATVSGGNSKAKWGKRMGLVIAWAMLGVSFTLGAVAVPNPNSPLKTKKVLVLTGGQLQDHGPAKDATLTNLQAFAAKVPFSLTIGDPKTLTDAYLAGFDIIVFNYFFETQLTTVFPDAAKKAFTDWLLKPGKGWVGYHTSGANEYAKAEWTWYQENVTGMRYALHGNGTPEGIIAKTTDAAIAALPFMDGVPATFTAQDEWYDFTPESKVFTDGSKVLFYLSNASSMVPPRQPSPIHPVAWIRQDAVGTRYFYTPFGHTLAGANSDWFKSIILRALEYVSGDPVTLSLTPKTESNVLSATPTRFAAGQALPVDIPGKYNLSVWSPEGRLLASVNGEGKGSYSLAPLKNRGNYFLTLASKSAKISQRLEIF